MINFLNRLTGWVLKGGNITFKEALRLSEIREQRDIISLISFANIIREELKGPRIDLRTTINVKTSLNGDDCGVCFQSASYDMNMRDPSGKRREFISKKAEESLRMGVNGFNIVFCGESTGGDAGSEAINILKKKYPSGNIDLCASMGMLTGEMASLFEKFCSEDDDNNIIETEETFARDVEKAAFFNERISILQGARDRGYKICSGVIFGRGETEKERLILAYALKEFDVDSIAINFSKHKKGEESLSPLELLKIIAIYRFIHPHRDIIIGGKKWSNFKTIKPLIYLSGANAVMIGNFLAETNFNALEGVKSLEDLIPVKQPLSQSLK